MNFDDLRRALRPGVTIAELTLELGLSVDAKSIGQCLRANGWHSKRPRVAKGAPDPRRWYPSVAVIPVEHRVRGESTLYGEGGAAVGHVEQQWVKTERDRPEVKAE